MSGEPVHVLSVGVTVYTTDPSTVLVTRFRICVMLVPLPGPDPVTPVAAAVQLNVVVAPKLLPSVIAVAPPLQIESEGGVAVATGNGFTVTVAVIGVDDEQPFALGVMVYTTVPGVIAVAVNTCAMDDPLAADAPVALVAEAVQENVVPETDPDNPMDVDAPEQIV